MHRAAHAPLTPLHSSDQHLHYTLPEQAQACRVRLSSRSFFPAHGARARPTPPPDARRRFDTALQPSEFAETGDGSAGLAPAASCFAARCLYGAFVVEGHYALNGGRSDGRLFSTEACCLLQPCVTTWLLQLRLPLIIGFQRFVLIEGAESGRAPCASYAPYAACPRIAPRPRLLRTPVEDADR